ncbi:hypothetical protein T4B_10299 [Trichinella pseudospiralis]|uniref:Uncharacterized protein n=1 Tax=Trichinella pseudospiralis TaxID=6337 RepID=A0A0V1JF36_TRIPS|nr:hypothetical protein T4A_3460 [Trichinella pseudospiralis]KRZ33501.1 hypothetical protein T4B_10299 [Trichinella pseudospiralis]KRZ41300.1 hypothetical protein T4C_4252 [Trichinella pseudospiralis]
MNLKVLNSVLSNPFPTFHFDSSSYLSLKIKLGYWLWRQLRFADADRRKWIIHKWRTDADDIKQRYVDCLVK